MDFATLDTTQGLAASRRTPAPHHTADPTKARKAAEDFESFFLSQVFEEMYSGIEVDKEFGGGEGESMFRSMLLQEYGKSVAQRGGVGIADAVQKEILKLQEAQK